MHYKVSEELRHEAPPAARNNQSAYTKTYFPCQKAKKRRSSFKSIYHPLAPLLGSFMPDVLLLKYDFGFTGLPGWGVKFSESKNQKKDRQIDVMFIQGCSDVWEKVYLAVSCRYS